MAKRNPPITLQSSHFRNSPEVGALTLCLNDDVGHIQQGATGDKVRRIQQALRNVPGVTIPDSEFDTMRFGPETAKAVLKFKGPPRNILQPWQQAPDPIVGMRTLFELDKLMQEGGGGVQPVPPTPGQVQIIPFHEPVPMLMAEQKHDPMKSDLQSSPRAPTGPHFTPPDLRGHAAITAVKAARLQPTFMLESDLGRELAFGGSAGQMMFKTFKDNSIPGREVPFGFGSEVGRLTSESPEFKAADQNVREEIVLALRQSAQTGILDYHVLKIGTGKVSPVSISFSMKQSRKLKFSIGSVQGSRVLLEDFEASQTGVKVTFKATVIYEMFDHFGADDEDLLLDGSAHGTPGQIALWILQRERRPGHCPFVPKIMIRTVIEDTL